MNYTMGEMVEKTGISAYTFRYYEKEGLLPVAARTTGGRRVFSDQDLSRIELIQCLKNAGMSLKEIREFLELCVNWEDEAAAERRRELLLKNKEHLEGQIRSLQQSLDMICYKIEHYREVGRELSQPE